jgi:hypothetical protein
MMKEGLADPEASISDQYLLAVGVAAASEHRMGNIASAGLHVQAAKRILELRGGLKAIREVTYPLGLMVVNIFVELGVDGLWKSQPELHARVTALTQWIRDAQAWNFTLRHQIASAPTRVRDYPSPDSDGEGDQTTWLIADDQSRRARAFASKTALADYITLPPAPLTEAQCRFYLSILFAINRALYAFRGCETTTNAYLTGLTAAVEMSAFHNFALRAGGAKLPSMLLLLMIAHSAVNTGSRDQQTDVVFHVEELFEIVQLVMMASPKMIFQLLTVFESWLTAPIADSSKLKFMNNPSLAIFAQEVEQTWDALQAVNAAVP